jgi:hypothetical protein
MTVGSGQLCVYSGSQCPRLFGSPVRRKSNEQVRAACGRPDTVALTFAEMVAAGAGFGRRLEYPVVGVA